MLSILIILNKEGIHKFRGDLRRENQYEMNASLRIHKHYCVIGGVNREGSSPCEWSTETSGTGCKGTCSRMTMELRNHDLRLAGVRSTRTIRGAGAGGQPDHLVPDVLRESEADRLLAGHTCPGGRGQGDRQTSAQNVGVGRGRLSLAGEFD
jgi:hypothetical protein